jgi:hypothetical protein
MEGPADNGRYLTAPFKERAVLMAAPAGPRAVKVARRCMLRRKALADVVEAMIGSFFEAGGALLQPCDMTDLSASMPTANGMLTYHEATLCGTVLLIACADHTEDVVCR